MDNEIPQSHKEENVPKINSNLERILGLANKFNIIQVIIKKIFNKIPERPNRQ